LINHLSWHLVKGICVYIKFVFNFLKQLSLVFSLYNIILFIKEKKSLKIYIYLNRFKKQN
jgi:hypothetical protein